MEARLIRFGFGAASEVRACGGSGGLGAGRVGGRVSGMARGDWVEWRGVEALEVGAEDGADVEGGLKRWTGRER